MNQSPLSDVISFARQNSPFYRDLYHDLPSSTLTLDQLPVLETNAFWEANCLEDNRVFTGPVIDGIVLRSGGTTGKPKFSIFAKDEWERFTAVFGEGIARNGLKEGDRIANIFYIGQLYGSFLFTHRALEQCPTRVLQLPIAGSTSITLIYKMLVDFQATVVAGVPTTLLGLVEYLEAHPGAADALCVRLIFFAGEAMYPDQRRRLARVLPQTEIRSIGYASTDAGLLGYADLTCGPNEFRCRDGFSAYEIIDEVTGSCIIETGLAGRAVVTDFNRFLMPIIRYPVGDRALWIDPPATKDRKFLLLGRADESARVGPVSLTFEDVRVVLSGFQKQLGDFAFQLVLVHRDSHDGLVVRLAACGSQASLKALEPKLIGVLLESRPMLADSIVQGKVLPINIDWVVHKALETNPRTGKLKRIIDTRR